MTQLRLIDDVLQKFDNLQATVANTCDMLMRAYRTDSPLKNSRICGLTEFNWQNGYAYELRLGLGVLYVYSHMVETGTEAEERRKFPVFSEIQARYTPMPKGLKSRYLPAGTFVAKAVSDHLDELVPAVDQQLALEEVKRTESHELQDIDQKYQRSLLKAQEELPIGFERPHDTYTIMGSQVDVYRGGLGGATEANADDFQRGGLQNTEADFLSQRRATWEQQRAQLGHGPDWVPGVPSEDTKYVSLKERRKRGLTGNRPSTYRMGEAGRAVYQCEDCRRTTAMYNANLDYCPYCFSRSVKRLDTQGELQ